MTMPPMLSVDELVFWSTVNVWCGCPSAAATPNAFGKEGYSTTGLCAYVAVGGDMHTAELVRAAKKPAAVPDTDQAVCAPSCPPRAKKPGNCWFWIKNVPAAAPGVKLHWFKPLYPFHVTELMYCPYGVLDDCSTELMPCTSAPFTGAVMEITMFELNVPHA